jgi:hypothetical protein
VYRKKSAVFNRKKGGDSRTYFSVHSDATRKARAVLSMMLQCFFFTEKQLQRLIAAPTHIPVLINPWKLQISGSAGLLCSIVPIYSQKTIAFFASPCHTCLVLPAAVAAAADSETKKHISLPY